MNDEHADDSVNRALKEESRTSQRLSSLESRVASISTAVAGIQDQLAIIARDVSQRSRTNWVLVLGVVTLVMTLFTLAIGPILWMTTTNYESLEQLRTATLEAQHKHDDLKGHPTAIAMHEARNTEMGLHRHIAQIETAHNREVADLKFEHLREIMRLTGVAGP